ncbi:hypothetical protein C8Q77DRAFT_360392 [Trametes polyzona]|nr:hypothetical protein C8Q77DRAFT_360392 [Trametes polyzona]
MIITSISDPFSDEHSGPPSPTDTLLPDYASQADIPPPSLPPSYALTARPSRPQIYTFSSRSNTSMVLLPSSDVDSTLTPVYNISVSLNLNPFAPLSYVTAVRRGLDEESMELVGEFELGVMHSRATLTMNGRSTRMSSVLKQEGYSPRKWKWEYGGVTLRWDCRATLDDGSPMCICSDSSSHQIASFVPPPPDPPQPPPAATLTVFPDGHEAFDHILLSALVIERKITMSF